MFFYVWSKRETLDFRIEKLTLILNLADQWLFTKLLFWTINFTQRYQFLKEHFQYFFHICIKKTSNTKAHTISIFTTTINIRYWNSTQSLRDNQNTSRIETAMIRANTTCVFDVINQFIISDNRKARFDFRVAAINFAIDMSHAVCRNVFDPNSNFRIIGRLWICSRKSKGPSGVFSGSPIWINSKFSRNAL